MHELGWWGGGAKCLIKMVYDAIPRVTAACFLFRIVFSVLMGAIQSLLSMANIRLCAPLSTRSQGTSLGSLAADDAGEGEGFLPKAMTS